MPRKVNGKISGKLVSKKSSKDRHPLFKEKLSRGQRAADIISKFGGSWTFIGIFFLFLFVWMGVNTWLLYSRAFDPFPYILLNLVLSCLAAIQAPIILMAQNRQAERDRLDAKYDHAINRKSERENVKILNELKTIKRKLAEK